MCKGWVLWNVLCDLQEIHSNSPADARTDSMLWVLGEWSAPAPGPISVLYRSQHILPSALWVAAGVSGSSGPLKEQLPSLYCHLKVTVSKTNESWEQTHTRMQQSVAPQDAAVVTIALRPGPRLQSGKIIRHFTSLKTNNLTSLYSKSLLSLKVPQREQLWKIMIFKVVLLTKLYNSVGCWGMFMKCFVPWFPRRTGVWGEVVFSHVHVRAGSCRRVGIRARLNKELDAGTPGWPPREACPLSGRCFTALLSCFKPHFLLMCTPGGCRWWQGRSRTTLGLLVPAGPALASTGFKGLNQQMEGLALFLPFK